MNKRVYICKSGQVADLLNKNLPEGSEAYPVYAGICGARFDSIEILFEPTDQKEIEAIRESFLTRLMPSRKNMDFIDWFYREYPCDT
jgi:hypothetical protein